MSRPLVAVLYGGVSAERDISLRSGEAVIRALQSKNYQVKPLDLGEQMLDQVAALEADFAFIALHGGAGEDGRIQALLEMRGLAYSGSGMLASALAMDKVRCKQLWQGVGLPTADFCLLNRDTDWEGELQKLGGHLMVKPVHEGSSIGMSQVRTAAELQRAFELASGYDDQVMAESWISGKEYSISVLGEDTLPIIQLEVGEEFYNYQAKYQSATTRYICPAPLDSKLEAEMRQLALEAFNTIGCSGWGRVDLIVDNQANPWLLEVNTVPGLTDHSLVPMSAKQAGYSFADLIEQIIKEASHD